MKKLTELIDAIKPSQIFGETNNIIIENIAYDSRKASDNSLFVAINGSKMDGANFIESAIKAGAKAIIAEKTPEIINNDIVYIIVENARLALAQISHCFYDYPSKDMICIGITGTNGKTTTTYLLQSIFQAANIKCGIIGTTGIFIDDEKIPATHTTPESLELCQILSHFRDKQVKIAVMETSSHALCQYRTAGIHFKAAAFSNLTKDHLDFHKTIIDYANAKKILFDSLDSNALAIVNDDDNFADYMLKDCASNSKYFLGRASKTDIQIKLEKLSLKGAKFKLEFKGEEKSDEYEFNTILLGKYNIDNAAMAAAIAILSGLEPSVVIDSLAKAQGAPGRMQRFDLPNGALAFVDYAHTPDALDKALKACRETLLQNGLLENKLICVFGCGGDRDRSKRPEMGAIGAQNSDYAIITNDNPRSEKPGNIILDILEGIDDKSKIKILEDRAEAIKEAYNKSVENDIILIAGKGHENYQIIGDKINHFSDCEELQKIIDKGDN